jgi:hypothetical protein
MNEAAYLSQIIVFPLALLDKIGQLRGKELRRHLGQSARVLGSEQSM